MSQSTIGSKSKTLALPVPAVRLSKTQPTAPYNYVDSSQPNGLGATAYISSYPEIVAEGIPTELFNTAYGLRLEVLRYRRMNGEKDAKDRAKYVRPSHWVGGVAESGNDRGGGAHWVGAVPLGFDVRTYWPVTSRGQVIPQNELTAFFRSQPIIYWDALNPGNKISITALIPRGNRTYHQNGFGKRYPYGGNFFPGYFRWRYSIIDPDDARGGRIDGPQSVTVAVSHKVFPFIFTPNITDALNHKHCVIDPRFSIDQMQAWIGGTRLPH